LAVGVDNMFILVTHHERNKVRGKNVAETVGKTLGEVGPSLVLTTFSEAACFSLGITVYILYIYIFFNLSIYSC
jgi:Niemann-Pick C1 protein